MPEGKLTNEERAILAFRDAVFNTNGLYFSGGIKANPIEGDRKFSCTAEFDLTGCKAAGDVKIKPQGIRVNITFVTTPSQGEKFTAHHRDYYHI